MHRRRPPACKALLLAGLIAFGVATALLRAGSTIPPALPAEAPSDAALHAGYAARAEQMLAGFSAATNAADPNFGGLVWVALNYARGTHLDWARARLASLCKEPSGNMFWMYPLVTLMTAGGHHLDAADWALVREVWRTYYPYRGDTENHWLMYYASLYLAAETWPDSGPEAWYNGKSGAENLAEARDYFAHWVRVTTSYGQGEYDSPHYLDTYVIPLALLAGWARDEQVRATAHAMLDYVLADYAFDSLEGIYGGATSRIYESGAIEPSRAPSYALGWMLFGLGENRANPAAAILALSGYRPPAILHRIARDRAEPYVHRELKRTRWRMRHAGLEAASFEVEGRRTVPVYKYTYVDPDFILGSSQGGLLQPIQQMTWSLIWRTPKPGGASNIHFALHPYFSPLEGTMFFADASDTVVDLIARSKVTYNSPDKLTGGSQFEQVFQHRGTLIGLQRIPEGASFPYVTAFFSRDLARREEDPSGWIFCAADGVYFAYRPLAPGEWKPAWWSGLLASGVGGWIAQDFKTWGTGHEVLVSPHLRNGYVLQVAPAREYADFDAFRGAILQLPLAFDLDGAAGPRVAFTSLDGARMEFAYGGTPAVDGVPRDFASWPLFDGPFASASRGSGELLIRHGAERLLLKPQAGQTSTFIEGTP